MRPFSAAERKRACGKATGARGATAELSGGSDALGDGPIRDEKEYRRRKKVFDVKYKEYKQLDEQLELAAAASAAAGSPVGSPAVQEMNELANAANSPAIFEMEGEECFDLDHPSNQP